jgi:hypothetical protein
MCCMNVDIHASKKILLHIPTVARDKRGTSSLYSLIVAAVIISAALIIDSLVHWHVLHLVASHGALGFHGANGRFFVMKWWMISLFWMLNSKITKNFRSNKNNKIDHDGMTSGVNVQLFSCQTMEVGPNQALVMTLIFFTNNDGSQ